MIKGSIQEDKTIVNIYVPTIGAPQYTRQMLRAIKGKTDSNRIIMGEFSTPLIPMGNHPDRKLMRKHKP